MNPIQAASSTITAALATIALTVCINAGIVFGMAGFGHTALPAAPVLAAGQVPT